MAGNFFHPTHPRTHKNIRLTLLSQILIFWEKNDTEDRKSKSINRQHGGVTTRAATTGYAGIRTDAALSVSQSASVLSLVLKLMQKACTGNRMKQTVRRTQSHSRSQCFSKQNSESEVRLDNIGHDKITSSFQSYNESTTQRSSRNTEKT